MHVIVGKIVVFQLVHTLNERNRVGLEPAFFLECDDIGNKPDKSFPFPVPHYQTVECVVDGISDGDSWNRALTGCLWVVEGSAGRRVTDQSDALTCSGTDVVL